MALREEAFLDQAKIESYSGVSFGVTRPAKDAANPIWPTLASDGSVPDWGVGYVSVRQNGATTELFTTCFESPDIDYVHLGSPQTTDGVTIARPSRGLVTFNGNTSNNLITPGGLTRNQYRVAYDDTLGQYVCIVYVDTGSGLAIDIYTAAAPLTAGWGSAVKRLTNPFGTGYCEPMAFWRRTDGRAVLYCQGITSGHASYGGLRRHVAMLLGPADGSLTGTWTSLGNILTAPSDDVQYYHSGAWVDGELVYVPVGIFDGTNSVPSGHSFNGTINRIHKVALYTARADDGSVLTLADASWLSSTGVEGDFDGGEIIGANNVAEVDDEWRYYYGADEDTHHQTPELSRLLGLATVSRRRVGYMRGPGWGVITVDESTDESTRLAINSGGSGVTVELLDPDTGDPLTGWEQADCDAIPADNPGDGHTVTWGGSPDTPTHYSAKVYLDTSDDYAYFVQVEESAAEVPPDVGLTLDESSIFTQSGTAITARALTGRRSSVGATAYSETGGAIWVTGDDTALFDIDGDPVDGETSIVLTAGVPLDIELGVTPVEDGPLVIHIGVPE